MKETNLDLVKETSKVLFDLVSFEDADKCVGMDGFIISHPYTNSGISKKKDGTLVNLVKNKEDQKEFRNIVFERIDKADNIIKILLLLNKPYLLLWYKMVSPFLSEKDFAKLLGEIWTISENPNCDLNVPLERTIGFFEESNKEYLMDIEEFEIYSKLPDEFTVYRGVSKGRNPYGLSYSLDKSKAIWFQKRFADSKNPGQLITRKVKKEDVLAVFTRRGEDEIVININHFIGDKNISWSN